MKPALALGFCFCSAAICFRAQGQNAAETTAIVAEGKRLYRVEMASWHGTDLFLATFPDQQKNIGGYFSYANQGLTNCIFFDKSATPRVLATIVFDSTYTLGNAQVDSKLRAFTPRETDLYSIREQALAAINQDTTFRTYQNTNLNLIPLISGPEKKVYVLTGPQTDKVVLFGNDYLLKFDAANKLVSQRRLHQNLIPMKYGQQLSEGQEAVSAMHAHLPATGDYITATDICTLMLYGRFAQWKQHYVVSKNYISIWDCERNDLTVLTRKAWDRIGRHQGRKTDQK